MQEKIVVFSRPPIFFNTGPKVSNSKIQSIEKLADESLYFYNRSFMTIRPALLRDLPYFSGEVTLKMTRHMQDTNTDWSHLIGLKYSENPNTDWIYWSRN